MQTSRRIATHTELLPILSDVGITYLFSRYIITVKMQRKTPFVKNTVHPPWYLAMSTHQIDVSHILRLRLNKHVQAH
jgi:hypothetical protein